MMVGRYVNSHHHQQNFALGKENNTCLKSSTLTSTRV
jgi:hypothetical protein